MFHTTGPQTTTGRRNRQDTPTILIVDDCSQVLDSLRLILEQNDYSVAAASSAIEALKMVAVEPPDLILSDWMMPDRDGLYLHNEVRQNPVLSEVPFVFLTALSSDEKLVQAKSLGCDDYITKPFDPDHLLATVAGKIEVAKRRRKYALTSLQAHSRRIIHTLSHEFRTPLVSINTGAEVLRDQLSALGPDQVDCLLDSIQRGGQRLERLVEDFMLLQQIDLGFAAQVSEQYRNRLPLFSLVESAVEGFVDRLPENSSPPKVRVHHRLGELEQPGLVDVYDVQVSEVLQRLLCNAYKFGGHGNTIEVRVEYSGSYAETVIRDHGPGFSSEKNEINIFKATSFLQKKI